MTLPNEQVLNTLKKNYVFGWDNISDEKYVGDSHGYDGEDNAVGTTNGAGPRNTQLFVIAPDGTVIHALPGYWQADDLLDQLSFADELYAVYKNKKLSKKAKAEKFKEMQIAKSTSFEAATKIRSRWQGFDAKNEMKRLKSNPDRDTFMRDAEGKLVPLGKKDKEGNTLYRLKPICQVVHERMAARPFVAFDKFDVEAYVDYGRVYYDNNKNVDGVGETFETARKEEMKEKRKQRKEEMKKAFREFIAEHREDLAGLSRAERKAKMKELKEEFAEKFKEQHKDEEAKAAVIKS